MAMTDNVPCLEKSPIAEHLDAIRALRRGFAVVRLEVFGSVCRPEFDPARSDVDFLIEYPPDYEFCHWLGRYFDLQEALSTLLQREVDLVMVGAIRNPRFRRVADETRTLIYETSRATDVA